MWAREGGCRIQEDGQYRLFEEVDFSKELWASTASGISEENTSGSEKERGENAKVLVCLAFMG